MPDNSNREKEIFEHALDFASIEERRRYVESTCGGDTALRERIEALLRADEAGEEFLPEQPKDTVRIITEKPGDTIGRYKLLQQIGEGGCGVVYMAEQEEPLHRRVALKVIKLGMDTKQVIARFEAERQALALMDHPNIAKVLDAGATETGRPYFVMELVRGIKITDFCDDNKLSTEDRLKLFIQICQAIQHAHQKGVIHRDIKPSNILVTVNDGVPVPKVIDFGIAKATAGRLTDQTLFTAFEQFIGTPAYMSPEQAVMTSLDIDTRSDIYSLGVLLYELLTGRTPFDQKELLAAGLDEMRRTIREKEPPRPSTCLSTLAADALTTTANERHTDAPKLIHLLRGDLDWIAMKCLEKDRQRRYETANGLASDIQRHLANEPVAARPPSAAYRFQKLVRRNKTAFATAAAIATVLVLGLVASTVEAIRATRAEREQARLRQFAETKEKKSEQVAKFLTEMLNAAGPGVARGRDATVLREILEQAATRVGKELKDQPEVQGDLWFSIGDTYAEIGDTKRAITNLQHAVDSYRTAFGAAHSKLALALVLLGQNQSHDYDLSQGRTNAQSGLEMARKIGDREILAKCLASAAKSFDPWFVSKDGGILLREAIALRRQLGTNEDNLIALAVCLRALAASPHARNDPGPEAMGREALALFRQHLGNDDPNTANAAYGLGQTLREIGKFEEAEQLFRETLDSFRKLYDANYGHRHHVRRFLAETLVAQGKWSQAEDLASQWQEWNLLGRINVFHRAWERAVQNFASADDLLAIAFRNVGKEMEYSQLRGRYLDYALAKHEFGGDLSGKSFFLLPVTGDDLKRVERFAELTVPSNIPVWLGPKRRLAIALAEYRIGRFDAAAASATNAITGNTRSPDVAQAWFIQALAFGRMQQMESARTAFAKGDELVNRLGRNMRGDFLWDCDEWAIAECLAREAKALLESQPATQPKPTGN